MPTNFAKIAPRNAAGPADEPPAGERTGGNKATLQVLNILASFIGAEGRFTIGELSRQLGLSRNMVHRALHALASEGLLTLEPDGAFTVGVQPLAWAGGLADSFDLVALCRPFMEELSRLSAESVILSTIVGRSRVNIFWLHAPGPRVTHVQQGKAVPLHFLGNSRCLLAFLSDADIRDYVVNVAPMDLSPEMPALDSSELMADLSVIRRQGYALWEGTSAFRAAFVTWPVLDQNRYPHGVITVGGPLERFDRAKAEAFVALGEPVLERLNRQSSMFAAAPVFMSGKRPAA